MSAIVRSIVLFRCKCGCGREWQVDRDEMPNHRPVEFATETCRRIYTRQRLNRNQRRRYAEGRPW